MAGLAAVLGTGQTKYVAKRHDVSMNGLVREAIDEALADSGSTFDDIDAVVVGKAPDFFEGVMMPELFMADAVGATGKPLIRVHTAGSVGGSTAIVANLVGVTYIVQLIAVALAINFALRLSPGFAYRLAALSFASGVTLFIGMYAAGYTATSAIFWVPVIFAGLGRGDLVLDGEIVAQDSDAFLGALGLTPSAPTVPTRSIGAPA